MNVFIKRKLFANHKNSFVNELNNININIMNYIQFEKPF